MRHESSRRRSLRRNTEKPAFCEPLENRRLLSGAIFQTSNTALATVSTGPIITHPDVILIFWGAKWGNGTSSPSPSSCINAVGDIISGPYLRGLQSYNAGFGNGNITNTYFITDSSPGANTTDAQAQTFVASKINDGSLPRPTVDASYLYTVITQSGVSDPGENRNGDHSYGTDNQNHRFHYAFITNPSGSLDFFTNLISHEIAESMTDPEGTGWQVSNNGFTGTGWDEISDGTAQNFSARLDGYLVQSYWDNSRKAYLVPFGNGTKEIDATSTSGKLVINADQNGVVDNEVDLNPDVNGDLNVTLDHNIIGFQQGSGSINGTYNTVQVNAGNGNDAIAISDQLNGTSYTVDVNGGAGYNTVYFLCTNGADNVKFLGNNLRVYDAGDNYQWTSAFDAGLDTGVSEFDINPMGGDDTITIDGSNRPMDINATGGNKIYYLDSFNSNSALTIFGSSGNDNLVVGGINNGNLQTNLPSIGTLHFYGNGGADQFQWFNVNAAGNWNYTTSPGAITAATSGYSITALLDNIPNITIWGDAGNDTFTTLAGTDYSALILGNNGNDTFDVRGGVSMTCYGGNGDDSFIFGGGNLFGAANNATFSGDAGTNTLTLDDHNDATGRTWNIGPSSVTPVGISTISLSGFQAIAMLGGTAADTISVNGAFGIGVNVDGGAGGDSIYLGNSSPTSFGPNVSINGGDGEDAIYVNDVTLPSFATSLSLNGGNGLNALSVTEPSGDRYDLNSTSIVVRQGIGILATLSLANLDGVTVNGNALDNGFTITSAGSIFYNYTVNGGAGNDSFYLLPSGSTLLYSFDRLILNGGAGTDTFTYDGHNEGPNQVTFNGSTVSLFAGGLSSNNLALSGIESDSVIGGNADDVFNVNQFNSGAALSVSGGNGNDTLNFGAGNLTANITAMASFSYDGQAGNDTFNVLNAAGAGTWSYIVTNTYVETDQTSPATGYFLILNKANLEQVNVTADAGNDSLNVRATNAGENVSLDGGAGNDSLTVGYVLSVANIHSAISFTGNTGTDSVITQPVLDNGAHTFHVTTDSVSAFAGDNLFPAGGAFRFNTAESIDVETGSGVDTVYAQPNATATVSLNGGGPSTAPGDVLHLALAAAQGYVVHPNTPSTGSGNVTSSNLKTLTWSGFETGPDTDDIPPAVNAANINLNGIAAGGPGGAAQVRQQSVDVQFSENIGLITPASLMLMNTTTVQTVPAANMAVSYDASTHVAHFTFPGYPAGILPDGNYHGTIVASKVADTFGNAAAADTPFDFYFLGGDANHDKKVDTLDFNALAANFGGSNKLYSQADFNYDGVVDTLDFNTLAARFGKQLPDATAITMASAPGVGTSPFSRDLISDSAKSDILETAV